jgi:hypothetical protein
MRGRDTKTGFIIHREEEVNARQGERGEKAKRRAGLIARNQLAGQECPNSSHSRQNRGCDQQEPIENSLAPTDLLAEDLQIKCKWEYDANGKAQE